MAITAEEMQSIVAQVLSAVKTNSKTIEQLTTVTTLEDSNSFEVDGGKKITYGALRDLIGALTQSDLDDLQTAINKKDLSAITLTHGVNEATLTIKSNSKTLTCAIPYVGQKAGLITPSDKAKINETATIASNGQKTANDALSLANTLTARVTELTATVADKADATQITELAGAVADKADASQIADAVAKIGVLPFDGFITDVSEARYKPKGYIGYCIKEGLFVKYLGYGQIIMAFAPYNVGDTDINPNVVYRYGEKLYARSGVKTIKKYIDDDDLYAELKSYSATRPATVVLSEEEYEALVASGGVVDGTLYMTYDGTV